MDEAIQKKLLHELQHIDELIESFAPLLGATEVREPDLVELSALATESRPAIAAGPLRDKLAAEHGVRRPKTALQRNGMGR